jgi:hypothetical protein
VTYRVKTYDDYKLTTVASTLDFTEVKFNVLSFRFGANLNILPTSNTEATTIFNNLQGLTAASSVLRDTSTYIFGAGWDVLGTTSTNDPSNYTYIMYPTDESPITMIQQLPGTDVTTDFESIQTLSITTQFGLTVPYRVYKTKSPGAFASGVQIRIL